jgi:hypothetical protein
MLYSKCICYVLRHHAKITNVDIVLILFYTFQIIFDILNNYDITYFDLKKLLTYLFICFKKSHESNTFILI